MCTCPAHLRHGTMSIINLQHIYENVFFVAIFKACVRYFLTKFLIALQKLWKVFFISSKNFLFVLEIFKFLYFFSLPFRNFQIQKDKFDEEWRTQPLRLCFSKVNIRKKAVLSAKCLFHFVHVSFCYSLKCTYAKKCHPLFQFFENFFSFSGITLIY